VRWFLSLLLRWKINGRYQQTGLANIPHAPRIKAHGVAIFFQISLSSVPYAARARCDNFPLHLTLLTICWRGSFCVFMQPACTYM
jgi:hypothetical protein